MFASASGTAHNGNSELIALAENILTQTQAINEYLNAQNYAVLTLGTDSIGRPDTTEYVQLHSSLKQSLEDLQYLVEGPKMHFRALACQGYALAALQVALNFHFFTIVPAEGQISLEELAKKAGVDLDRTSRVVRFLSTVFIFHEPAPGFVAHNPSSYLLHADDEIRSTLGYTYVLNAQIIIAR